MMMVYIVMIVIKLLALNFCWLLKMCYLFVVQLFVVDIDQFPDHSLD